MSSVGEMFIRVAAAKTVDELAAAFNRILIDEHFDQFLVFHSNSFGEQRIMARCQPPLFEQWQQENRPRHRDVMADYAVSRGRPHTWIDAGSDEQVHNDVQSYAATASRLGLHNGLSIPVLASEDFHYVFHLSRSSPKLEIDDQNAVWRLVSMCLVTSQRLRQIEQAESIVEVKRPNLSAREIDVLRWIKDGKSYAEIGQIMSISSKTVEFHIANALRKLAVTNRISAIIACSKHGFFDL